MSQYTPDVRAQAGAQRDVLEDSPPNESLTPKPMQLSFDNAASVITADDVVSSVDLFSGMMHFGTLDDDDQLSQISSPMMSPMREDGQSLEEMGGQREHDDEERNASRDDALDRGDHPPIGASKTHGMADEHHGDQHVHDVETQQANQRQSMSHGDTTQSTDPREASATAARPTAHQSFLPPHDPHTPMQRKMHQPVQHNSNQPVQHNSNQPVQHNSNNPAQHNTHLPAQQQSVINDNQPMDNDNTSPPDSNDEDMTEDDHLQLRQDLGLMFSPLAPNRFAVPTVDAPDVSTMSGNDAMVHKLRLRMQRQKQNELDLASAEWSVQKHQVFQLEEDKDAEIRELKRELTNMYAKNNETAEENDALNRNFNRVSDENLNLKHNVSTLSKQLTETTDQLDVIAKQNEELVVAASHAGDIGQLKADFDKLARDYDSARSDYEELRCVCDAQRSEKDRIVDEHNKALANQQSRAAADLEHAHREVASTTSSNEELRRENVQLQTDCDKFKTEINQLTAQLAVSGAEPSDAQVAEQNSQLEALRNQVKEANDRLEVERDTQRRFVDNVNGLLLDMDHQLLSAGKSAGLRTTLRTFLQDIKPFGATYPVVKDWTTTQEWFCHTPCGEDDGDADSRGVGQGGTEASAGTLPMAQDAEVLKRLHDCEDQITELRNHVSKQEKSVDQEAENSDAHTIHQLTMELDAAMQQNEELGKQLETQQAANATEFDHDTAHLRNIANLLHAENQRTQLENAKLLKERDEYHEAYIAMSNQVLELRENGNRLYHLWKGYHETNKDGEDVHMRARQDVDGEVAQLRNEQRELEEKLLNMKRKLKKVYVWGQKESAARCSAEEELKNVKFLMKKMDAMGLNRANGRGHRVKQEHRRFENSQVSSLFGGEGSTGFSSSHRYR